ncbi:hypothetical protein NDU88_006129 [Pleurodeles waltl]|uniref:Uncharacterized protein n=1 Tax=Pleurodeles waltl TaxID=8319 RepID=A0AAV7PK75_PLEWA|nr:hypothetical protein NDU88_006129 [Pleurodeles waltl]
MSVVCFPCRVPISDIKQRRQICDSQTADRNVILNPRAFSNPPRESNTPTVSVRLRSLPIIQGTVLREKRFPNSSSFESHAHSISVPAVSRTGDHVQNKSSTDGQVAI